MVHYDELLRLLPELDELLLHDALELLLLLPLVLLLDDPLPLPEVLVLLPPVACPPPVTNFRMLVSCLPWVVLLPNAPRSKSIRLLNSG